MYLPYTRAIYTHVHVHYDEHVHVYVHLRSGVAVSRLALDPITQAEKQSVSESLILNIYPCTVCVYVCVRVCVSVCVVSVCVSVCVVWSACVSD